MASRAQGEETRTRLVHAAVELFAQQGARGTSLDAVAKAAGVTRQGLLHYFPSKTDLLLAVLEQRDQDDRATVTPAVRRLQESGQVTTGLDAEQLSAALLALLHGLNLQQLLDPELDHVATFEGV